MSKSLDTVSQEDTKEKVHDVKVVGNTNLFQLLCKASSKDQGWMKSCKAMEISGVGCIVQVTTQQGDNVAEALTFVPGVIVVPDANEGRMLVPMPPTAIGECVQWRAAGESPDGHYAMDEELEKRFTHHPPKAGQPEKYQAIRAKAKELAALIKATCPDSREQSVAITNVEQAVMWANAGIARRE